MGRGGIPGRKRCLMKHTKLPWPYEKSRNSMNWYNMQICPKRCVNYKYTLLLIFGQRNRTHVLRPADITLTTASLLLSVDWMLGYINFITKTIISDILSVFFKWHQNRNNKKQTRLIFFSNIFFRVLHLMQIQP